jgi:pyrroloquinoline quinone (PQQ) biosynthesis protein C
MGVGKRRQRERWHVTSVELLVVPRLRTGHACREATEICRHVVDSLWKFLASVDTSRYKAPCCFLW